MTTIAWSPRVGEFLPTGQEIIGDHSNAGLMKVRDSLGNEVWVPYQKARPGPYCTKPCCAKRNAPKTC